MPFVQFEITPNYLREVLLFAYKIKSVSKNPFKQNLEHFDLKKCNENDIELLIGFISKITQTKDGPKEKNDEIKSLSSIINNSNDVIPQEYEGGFKIWEGSGDLINYLNQTKLISSEKSILLGPDGKTVNILDVSFSFVFII